MAWVRIHDGAMGNLKIMRLSATAFRLWIRGLCYCQQHLTDGLIPREALKFLDAKRADVDMLCEPTVDGKAALWERIEGFGFKVHDYLDWNDSREVIEEKKIRARDRAHVSRTSRVSHSARAPHVASGVVKSTDLTTIQNPERESEGKPLPASSGRQAGRLFLHRWQLDALIDTLGAHAEGFGLDDWLEAINRRLEGHALPRDPWKWVQAELHTEIERRGIATADASQPQPTNKRIAGLMAGGEAFLRRAAEQKGRIA
jgi:hypothetical protein